MIFSIFADLHYKKGMYAVKVSDLEKILKRAEENQADFVVHVGDFCNDYIGSPELVNTYLNNKYHLSVYGIYGNHELESNGNSMETVTPLLTNDIHVVWGTKDGKIGDGSVGYYYFDREGYRIICTDSNYSYNEELEQWEHNKPASWGAPAGNIKTYSLGPEQLVWLEEVLLDAANQEITCIVLGHASYTNLWSVSDKRKLLENVGLSSPDTDKIQKIYKKINEITPRTVIMSINGHYHTNRMQMQDDIVYIDLNTVINGSWIPKEEHHYKESHTFELEDYDERGNIISVKEIPLSDLWQSMNTHYFNEPLSAIVEINDGQIVVKGNNTSWRYDIVPNNPNPGCMPAISNAKFVLE